MSLVQMVLSLNLLQCITELTIFGRLDPFRHGAYALYNVCDPDTAIIFDTGKGHTIPRSGQVIHELGDAVRGLLDRAHVFEEELLS